MADSEESKQWFLNYDEVGTGEREDIIHYENGELRLVTAKLKRREPVGDPSPTSASDFLHRTLGAVKDTISHKYGTPLPNSGKKNFENHNPAVGKIENTKER